MAELLDVKFNADGTAEDLSAMKMPIKTFAGPTLTMIENETFGYIAKFDPATVNQNKITSGFYTVDFTQNISFQNAIADGFSMELYVTAKDYGEKVLPFQWDVMVAVGLLLFGMMTITAGVLNLI